MTISTIASTIYIIVIRLIIIVSNVIWLFPKSTNDLMIYIYFFSYFPVAFYYYHNLHLLVFTIILKFIDRVIRCPPKKSFKINYDPFFSFLFTNFIFLSFLYIYITEAEMIENSLTLSASFIFPLGCSASLEKEYSLYKHAGRARIPLADLLRIRAIRSY